MPISRFPVEDAASRAAMPHPAPPAWADASVPVWKVLLPAGLLLAGAAAMLPIDAALAHWSLDAGRLDFMGTVLQSAEEFGNGMGIVFILLALLLLDPARRGYLPRAIALSLGGGLMANAGKLLVARMRPYQWMMLGKEQIGDAFLGWLPLGMNRGAEQSFPSAHTASAVGLAVALVWLYPRGRVLFVALAALVGLQRIAVDAHFASDVLAGAAVGWLTAVACFRLPGLNRFFLRIERGETAEGAVPIAAPRSATGPAMRRESRRQRRRGAATLRIDPGQRGLRR